MEKETMQTITHEELKDKLASLKASTAVAIETETEPKMLKKNRNTGEANPFSYGVIKIGTMAGLIGCHYENSVNNQLGREDKELLFEAKNRKWGTLMDNKVLVVHTPKGHTEPSYYLQILVKRSKRPIYTDGTIEIPMEEIKPFLPKKRTPKTQDDLDTKVILRDVNIKNIKIIRMLGEEYFVCSAEEIMEMEKIKTQMAKQQAFKVAKEFNEESIKMISEIFRVM